MVLVDTSIWVSHFRKTDARLQELLLEGSVICHSLTLGELACGNLGNRKEILSLLQTLPKALTVDDGEVLPFIEHNRLMGKGIGLVDVHLLASVLLSKASLWTSDKSLRRVCDELGVLFAA